MKLLELVRKELAGTLPVLVFAGAPFTLASYAIGTGKELDATRRFASEQTLVWDALLDRIGEATCDFLKSLTRAGADAYQLFDSWAGELTEPEYLRWALPWHRTITQSDIDVPSILFVKECPYVHRLMTSGANVISLGVTHDLVALRRQYPDRVFQGNVDEDLLRTGTPEQVAEATRRCIQQGGGQRHIVNLSHGVDRATPVANFEAYIATVKE